MNDNLIEAQYDVTKKNKYRKFYESNKILIFSSIFIFILLIASYAFYVEIKDNKKIELSENYSKAKTYLKNGDQNKAKNILENIVLSNDSTYSTLSLLLILDENLFNNQDDLIKLFDQVLDNNKFDKETKNLIIFKKVLFLSNYITEQELIKITKPLISGESIWKPHTLLLLGDFFTAKKEYLKAKEFYTEILKMKNLSTEFYEEARTQLTLN